MRKIALAAALAAVVAGGAAGCHSASDKAKAKQESQAALNTPQGKQAQALVQGCVDKYGANRKDLLNCIAPGGHKAALEACVAKVVVAIPSKAKLESSVANCVLENR